MFSKPEAGVTEGAEAAARKSPPYPSHGGVDLFKKKKNALLVCKRAFMCALVEISPKTEERFAICFL